MIFLNAQKEEKVQVADKTRIDVSSSFVSGDAITGITILPEVGGTAVSVFNADNEKWYLDWAYATAGEKTITVEATDGNDTVSKEFTIEVISEADDNLYSNDSQIFAIEGELKRYIPAGRNSFKNIHRESQSRILNYLDRKRIWKTDGTPYTKDQLNMENELQKWSLYEAILTIYTDLTISVGDKFTEKINEYKSLRNAERDRASIRIDKNSDGILDANEIQDLKSFRMIVR